MLRMAAAPAIVLLVALLAGCTTNAVVQEVMVINPHLINFASADSVKTVSITHTCTCPFSWSSYMLDSSVHWVVIAASHSGDFAAVPIAIDRSKLPATLVDSIDARVRIVSNEYGTDTITVRVHK